MPEELKERIREIINTPHGSVLEDAIAALVESECALRVDEAIKRWMLRGDNREPLERYVNERVGMALRAAAKHVPQHCHEATGYLVRCDCGWKSLAYKVDWTIDDGSEERGITEWREHILSLDLASVAALDEHDAEIRATAIKGAERGYEIHLEQGDKLPCWPDCITAHRILAHDAEVERKARLDEADQWLMSEALNKPNRMEWKIKRMAELNRAASSHPKESGK